MRVRARADVEVNYWLTAGREYAVIGLDEEHFRVLNDGGEPTLFAREEFEVLDGATPSDWVWRHFDDGEFHADPPGLHEPGFYEDYFDHEEYAVTRVDEYLRMAGIPRPATTKSRPRGEKEAEGR